jgi:ATP-binding cassette subfamily F protein 3
VDAPSLRLATETSPLLSLEKCTISYQQKAKNVLENVTLQVNLKSRIGIIGRNGKGKTTLMHALCFGDSAGGIVRIPQHSHANKNTNTTTDDSNELVIKKGQLWNHHNLRIGIVSQHQIDLLSQHLFETPVTYIQALIAANPSIQQYYKTELDIRAHLGGFGLSGSLALQQIGSMSGGQKARLSFAIVCLQRPQLLFLDEPSNHLSMDSIESLITACQDFSGGIVIISHNRFVISKICNELWLVDNNGVQVKKPAVVEGGKGDGGSDSEGSDNEQSAFDDLLESCIQQILRSS